MIIGACDSNTNQLISVADEPLQSGSLINIAALTLLERDLDPVIVEQIECLFVFSDHESEGEKTRKFNSQFYAASASKASDKSR